MITPSFSRRSSAVLVVFALTFLRVATEAYTFEGPQWPNGSTVVMQLSLGNPGRTLSDGNTSWNAAAAPALDMWNRVLGGMQYGKVMNSPASVSSGDRVNSMAFSSTVFGESFGSNTLAVTYYHYSGSTMSEADILYNTAQQWDSYRGNLKYGSNRYAIADIQRVTLHESGHALGLGHPDEVGQTVTAIMNAAISNQYTLANDDISGGQALYGPNNSPTPTPPPTPTPVPTPTVTPTPITTPTPFPTPTPSVTPLPTPTSAGPSMSVGVSPQSAHVGGTVFFTITAATPVATTTTVNFNMTGTAVLNQNYTLEPSSNHVTFAAGNTSATVTLHVTNLNSAKKKKKRKRPAPTTFSATMNLAGGTGYTISNQKSATAYLSK